jgi:hypothetical protein
MALDEARQFSFRLPQELVDRLESCVAHVRSAGLDVTRADVVRLLLKHALDATRCKLELLLRSRPAAKRSARSKRSR